MRVVRAAVGPVVVAIATLLYTSGPLARMRTWFVPLTDDGVVDDDAAILAIYALIAVAGLAMLVIGGRWRQVPRPLMIAAAALTAWYLVSALWSGDAGSTVRNSIFIGTALLAGAGAAVALPLRTLAWSAWAGVHVGLLWSVVAIRRNVNSLDSNGDYAGVYFNRNSLALYTALGAVIGVVLVVDAIVTMVSRKPRDELGVYVLGVAAVVAVVVGFAIDWYLIRGADAATPTIAFFAAVAVGVVALLARLLVGRGVSARLVAAVGGGAIVVIGAVGWIARGSLFERLGRRSNLTGRADLWDVAIEWAGRRPIQGYGYLGAWADDQFVREVKQASKHDLFSAHNGFVEAYLGGGVVGLVVFTALIAIVFYGVATSALSTRSVVALVPLVLFMFVFVENLTETLVVGNQLVVVLLTATAVAAARVMSTAETPT